MAKKHAMAAADENPFGSSVTDVAASIVNQMKGDGGTLSPTPSFPRLSERPSRAVRRGEQ